MREHSTRLGVRRLYILGAGASFDSSKGGSQSAPLDKDFLPSILSMDLKHPLWIDKYKLEIANKYKGTNPFWTSGLEQAVINQLGQLDFLSTFHPKRAKDNIEATDWLDKLNALVCAKLFRAVHNSNSPYKTLAKDLHNSLRTDRVITFNYDTLLDKELLKFLNPQFLYFDRILNHKDQYRNENPCFSHPQVLKLHGSINWRCSTEDLHKSISGIDANHYIDNIWIENSRPSMVDDSRALIVPPLPDKPITQVSILKYLWRKAYEYLYEAEEIFIAGYSLPPTDRLARAMFTSFVNKSIRKVHIADPNGAMINVWRELFDRKGVHVDEWRYSTSFSEMIENECDPGW